MRIAPVHYWQATYKLQLAPPLHGCGVRVDECPGLAHCGRCKLDAPRVSSDETGDPTPAAAASTEEKDGSHRSILRLVTIFN